MDEYSEVVNLLSSMEPGRLPKEVFLEVARLTVLPVLELVPIYRSPEGLKVLLLRRKSDDPIWPDKYHVPGSIITAADDPGELSGPIGRLLENQLKPYSPGTPKLAGLRLCKTRRGTELAIIYSVDLGKQPEANLYELGSLPGNMIEGHRMFVKIAADALNPSS